MCNQCHNDKTVRIKAALTWAIPVDISVLGPRLEAYLKIKPLLDKLRLCHRYGQGPDVHIPKIPQELLDIVIEHLMIDARNNAPYEEWQEAFNCFQSQCDNRDHHDENELNDMRDDIRDEIVESGFFESPGVWGFEDFEDDDYALHIALEGIVETRLETVLDAEYGQHHRCTERRQDWMTMCGLWNDRQSETSQENMDLMYGFDKFDKVLRRDFGLAAFISHQRITGTMTLFGATGRSFMDGDPALTTISYLTLPSRSYHEEMSEEDGIIDVDESASFHAQSTFFNVIEDPASLLLTEEQRKRFAEAMIVLDLKPYLKITQLASVDHHHPNPIQKPKPAHGDDWLQQLKTTRAEADARIKECTESRWPKLLQLVSSRFDFDNSDNPFF